MKINKENQQRKSTGKFFEGIKFALGILFVFSIVGLVYAVGFHFPYEILPGQFANGNYSFNGSIGIGTSSPSNLLTIKGNGSVKGLFALIDSNGGNQWYFANGYSGNDDFDIYENSNNRLHISSGGNVGIGTTNPQAKLDVNGTLQIKNPNLEGSNIRIYLEHFYSVNTGNVWTTIKTWPNTPNVNLLGVEVTVTYYSKINNIGTGGLFKAVAGGLKQTNPNSYLFISEIVKTTTNANLDFRLIVDGSYNLVLQYKTNGAITINRGGDIFIREWGTSLDG